MTYLCFRSFSKARCYVCVMNKHLTVMRSIRMILMVIRRMTCQLRLLLMP